MRSWRLIAAQNDQIKAIEETKLTSKKRKGVAPFIKFFPTYISRVESQLIGSDTLEIRQFVDSAYDKIVQAMFDGLKQMAKMGGDEEDKGQLNYHVILIGPFASRLYNPNYHVLILFWQRTCTTSLPKSLKSRLAPLQHS